MQTENEMRADAPASESGVPEIQQPESLPSLFARLTEWVGKQSLPRLLGLLVGNTRELENRLADKDKELDWLRSQLLKNEEKYHIFLDSVLIGKGMTPTDPSRHKPIPRNQTTKHISSKLPGDTFAMETEIDKLMELLIYRPEQIDAVLNDLRATGTARNKMIVHEFERRVVEMPDARSGVLISN